MFAGSIVSACVLCTVAIIKSGDKNLIDGRAEFNAKTEILSLHFRVNIDRSSYICKSCLNKLRKRRSLISNLRDVNASLQESYCGQKSKPDLNAYGSSSTTTRNCSPPPSKRVALDQQSRESHQAFDIVPSQRLPMTSTPHKEQQRPIVHLPVSPIAHACELPSARACETSGDQNVNKKTTVQVRIDWPSKTKVNTLHEGLESLGKMLCRGTYKQIAGAVWKNAILRKHVQQLFLQEVDRECTTLCSLKHASCLRSPRKNDIQSFSFKKLNSELETRAPLFSAVLWTASLRKSKRDDKFWQPSVCMSAAVLLKNRSPCMNAIQLLNTIILYHTGIIVSNNCALFINYIINII